MVNAPVNVTDWADLMDGNMVSAVYHKYDGAFNNLGIIIVILFFTYQAMLYAKTKNLTITWIMGVMFAGMFVGASYVMGGSTAIFVNPFAVSVILFLLVLEFAAILFNAFFGGDA